MNNLFSLITKQSWRAANKRCKKHPLEAREANDSGWLPIHVACYKTKAPVYLIKSLYEAYPLGLKTVTSAGWLPINIASIGGASQETIDYLENISCRQDTLLERTEKKTNYQHQKRQPCLFRFSSDLIIQQSFYAQIVLNR